MRRKNNMKVNVKYHESCEALERYGNHFFTKAQLKQIREEV